MFIREFLDEKKLNNKKHKNVLCAFFKFEEDNIIIKN